MPRAKRKEFTPLDSGFFLLDDEEWQFLVYENLADQGGRGMHMLSKRSKAFDKVLARCEDGLKSTSLFERSTYERHTTGRTKKAEFARFIGSIVRPLVIGKTLKDDIVDMIRIHYRAVEAAQYHSFEK